MEIPKTAEGWDRCHRIVSSRHPPVGIFDDVARPEDLEGVYWVEGLTNPRVREEMGAIDLVPKQQRLSGPGTTPIMAAFTHLNPAGSRFSDGTFGVYYGADSARTAIEESAHHVARYARESHDPPTSFVMREYVGALLFHEYDDIRGMREQLSDVYAPDDYRAGQALARRRRAAQSWGILYDSMRHRDGHCIAAFRPTALGPVKQTRHYAYVWDGKRLADIQLLRSIRRRRRGQ